MFAVKYRRIEAGSKEIALGVFTTRAEADKAALALNCKPFCPFYAWAEVL